MFRYLVQNYVRVGLRVNRSGGVGELEWRPPRLTHVLNVLHHLMYAGAYVYGWKSRKRRRTRTGATRMSSKPLPMSEWKVLKRDHLPAYITWERYLANQERLQQNRHLPTSRGSPRRGSALLSGLLTCGTCGLHMRTYYPATGKAHYHCVNHLFRGTEQACYGLRAAALDKLVVQQVWAALEPAALELSLRAIDDIQKERAQLEKHWKQRLERARYEVQHAERQYQAVEPENRLVARTLEGRWEETLRQLRQLEEDHDRFLQEKPPRLSDAERARITALASDIPTLWDAPGTKAADHKEIIRCLVERVIVLVCPGEHVDVTIRWQGGRTSQHEVLRPVNRYEQLRDYDKLLERVVALRQEGHRTSEIAQLITQEGYLTPKTRQPLTPEMVRKLLTRRGLANEKNIADQLRADEW